MPYRHDFVLVILLIKWFSSYYPREYLFWEAKYLKKTKENNKKTVFETHKMLSIIVILPADTREAM